MKNIVTLSFLFLSLNIFCQKRFVAGIKAGLSTSQVEGDTYGGFDKAGLAAGITITGKMNEKWTAQMEMIYIQKGSKHNSNPDNGDFSYYYLALNYIEVPVLFQYHHKKFNFEIGPGFGYLINTHEYNENGDVYMALPFNSYELSASLGISYEILKNISINWRYTNSLAAVRAFQSGGRTWNNPGQRNNVLAFTLIYQFKGKDAQTE
ncbi:MAG: hypothetical protein K0Q95_327 [Bacteroidota bacterium]|jgi:hypothetical protein|nr:hypothetical protein [Bacteroidota bacterium]